MTNQTGLYIFGELLFDCFPSGKEILGGVVYSDDTVDIHGLLAGLPSDINPRKGSSWSA